MSTGIRVVVTGTLLALVAQVGAQTGTAPASALPPNPVVLTVNGSPVYAAEVALVMQSVAAQAQQAGAELSQDELIGAGTRQMVETRLLAQEARRREISVDTADVDAAMERIAEQNGGRAQLEASLNRGGMTYAQFRNGVEENNLVTRLVAVSIQPSLKVTDEEVAEYYAAHPERYRVPEKVHARHILLTTAAGDSDEQKAAARAKAEAARKRVLEGEDFAAVATEVSQCPSSAQGGDLGFFAAEDMIQPFAEAAFAMKPGDTSEVVETQFGYHVIRVDERQAAATRTLDESRDRIRSGLEREKVSQAVGELLEKLTADAAIVEAPGLADSTPSGETVAPE